MSRNCLRGLVSVLRKHNHTTKIPCEGWQKQRKKLIVMNVRTAAYTAAHPQNYPIYYYSRIIILSRKVWNGEERFMCNFTERRCWL